MLPLSRTQDAAKEGVLAEGARGHPEYQRLFLVEAVPQECRTVTTSPAQQAVGIAA